MAVGYNPRAITDGLVLALDAGSPKNYNAGISTNWTDKVGGNNGTLVNGTYHTDGPFVGAGYVEFDGSGDYLTAGSASDWTFLNDGSTFTAECWFYSQSTSQQTLLNTASTQSAVGFTVNLSDTSTGDIAVAIYKGTSGALKATSTGTLWNTNTWNHVAVVYSSSTLTIYLNGVSVATADGSSFAFNGSNPSFTLAIGRYQLATPGGYVDGYISNVRLVNGTALYTSNFTPPTGPLTAITNTTLLTCQGNTIADASSSAHTITANGDISLTKEPFAGAGAVAFDGTSDYLDIASSTDFAFGTGDFTIEVWVYLKSNTLGVIYSNEVANSLFLYLSSGNLVVRNYGTTNLFDLTAPSLNTWTHIALSRSGTDLRLFFNGVQQGSTVTNSTNWTQNGTEIGAYSNGSQSLNGYMSNLRVIKGEALYTAAFTPPSRTLEPIENTVLLTCQGQNIKDYSSSAHAITVNGDAKATIVSSAFEFDGSNYDYILSAANPTLNWGTGDFTVELWVNVSSSSTYGKLFSTEVNAQEEEENTFVITMNNSLQVSVTTYSTVLISASSATAISANTWTHIVVTRQGTTLTLYIDKSSAGTATSSINYVAGGYTTGALPRSLTNTNWSGKISNIKVYKGKALTVAEIEQNYNATKGRYA